MSKPHSNPRTDPAIGARWIVLHGNNGERTDAMNTPTGCIVRSNTWDDGTEALSMVVVPGVWVTPGGEWTTTQHVADLVYLSCPFGGKEANLYRATEQLAWAHGNTSWGLRVQAPWISSAFAELLRGTSEAQWKAMGGQDVERSVLRGYGILLHAGHTAGQYSPGQRREALVMVADGGRVYERVGDEVLETTADWRAALEGGTP